MSRAAVIVAVVLIVLGVLALSYGRITYTEETHEAQLGPIELSVEDKETIHIPTWAGVIALAAGTAVLIGSLMRKA